MKDTNSKPEGIGNMLPSYLREFGYTAREWKEESTRAYARIAVETQKKPYNRGPITNADVDYLTKCANAPDVNTFLQLMN